MLGNRQAKVRYEVCPRTSGIALDTHIVGEVVVVGMSISVDDVTGISGICCGRS